MKYIQYFGENLPSSDEKFAAQYAHAEILNRLLGCFTVDTDYKSAGEIFKQYEQIHNEFTVLGNIRLNKNGVIIRSENG